MTRAKVWITATFVVGLLAGAFWPTLDAQQPVTVASSALPTGASTLAEQQTQTTSLSTIAGDTTDIEAAIEGLDHAEDSVHSSTHMGIMFLAVRQDSPVDLAADGDYIPPTIDADGGLRVSIVAGAGLGGTAVADDADITAGTTSFTPIGGFYQSTVTACTDGDGCMAGITSGRALKAHLTDAAGASLTLASDMTVGSAYGTAAPGGIAMYSDFDGSAIPTATNVDTEGEAVPIAASIKGVQYMMLVSEDGSLQYGTSTTPMVVSATNLDVQIGGSDTVTVTATNLDIQSGGADVLSTTAFDATFGTAGTADAQVRSVQGIASMTPLLTQPQAVATGGADGFRYISVGSTEDEHAVKASAGTLYSITVTNTNAAVRYLKCENDTAANTAPGTDTPEIGLAVPGATTGAGFTTTFPVGYAFSNALTCWLVTGAADSDVAEVAANELMVFYTFK